MTDSQTPPEPKRRGMPRNAIKAIAGCGFLCGAMTAFLALFAYRMGFPFFFVILNLLTAVFMAVGSAWMLAQLRKA